VGLKLHAELVGTDLRREPLETRKATLASVLRQSSPGLRLNEHLEHPEGAVVFQHACKMGLEWIVSKRLGSPPPRGTPQISHRRQDQTERP
jgi:bifunctional non-homologous end joining protein LigD